MLRGCEFPSLPLPPFNPIRSPQDLLPFRNPHLAEHLILTPIQGLANPPYRRPATDSNWFTSPEMPNNWDAINPQTIQQQKNNQQSYAAKGWETYDQGMYACKEKLTPEHVKPIEDWVPGEEPAWQPIAGGQGYGISKGSGGASDAAGSGTEGSETEASNTKGTEPSGVNTAASGTNTAGSNPAGANTNAPNTEGSGNSGDVNQPATAQEQPAAAENQPVAGAPAASSSEDGPSADEDGEDSGVSGGGEWTEGATTQKVQYKTDCKAVVERV